MDDIVKQAMAKWPKVPACYDWLGLDARGQWWMRDDRCQAAGSFADGCAGHAPAAKGSRLQHEKLTAFIARNYLADEQGRWFFQNGPQRVFLELEATPWVIRVADGAQGFALSTHTDAAARMQRCWVDEIGHVYAETDLGLGLIHSQDVAHAAQAIEQGLWVPHACDQADLELRFGFVKSPSAQRSAASTAAH